MAKLESYSQKERSQIMACQFCGQNVPTKYATLNYNIGMLVMYHLGTLQGEFCQSCLTRYFWKYTLITLVFGWWGFLSFFITIVILLNNVAQFLKKDPVPATEPISNVAVSKCCLHCHSPLSTVADFSRIPWGSLINSSILLMLAGILTLALMISQTTAMEAWFMAIVLYGIILFKVGSLILGGHFSRKVCKQCGQPQSVVA